MRPFPFSAIIIVGAIFFTGVGTAEAQSLPGDAASTFIKSLSEISCRTIPIGQQKWNIDFRTNGISDTSDYNDGRSALAFQRMGLINVTTIGVLGTEGTFNVTLKGKIDGVAIRLRNNMPCMQEWNFSTAAGTIVKSEPIKGGQTKWTGMIAYVEIPNMQSTPLHDAFLRAQGTTTNLKTRQFRVLYRQDSFTSNWRVVTWDVYLGEKYLTNRVLERMQED